MLFLFASCGSTPPAEPETEPEQVVEVEEDDEEEVVVEKAPEIEEKPNMKVSVQKYTVKYGDTLSKIALKYYGTRAKAYYFPIIMCMNPGLIKHPDKLKPKMVLNIPNYDEFMANSEYKEKSKPDFKRCIEIYKREKRRGVVKALQKRLNSL